VLPPSLSYRTS